MEGDAVGVRAATARGRRMKRMLSQKSVEATLPNDPLERRIAALERIIAGLQRQQPDPLADERFIGAIAITFGNKTFSAADLIAARLVRTGGVKTGRRLQRLHGRSIAGYRLIRVSRDRAGCL